MHHCLKKPLPLPQYYITFNMATRKSKSAKWKAGVGLEMVQHLLSLCKAKLSHPSKGAGPAARRENVEATYICRFRLCMHLF